MLNCRLCFAELRFEMVDLGLTPLANELVTLDRVNDPETFYPLVCMMCESCFLVQVSHTVTPAKIFEHYTYRSSFSSTWLQHVRRFSTEAIERFSLGKESLVIEIASNDGCLLANFVEQGIPVLGVEPARNLAAIAVEVGVPTRAVFLGLEEARRIRNEHGGADLLVANNVLAHVPDLHDFVSGLSELLSSEGVLSLEVPWLLNIVEQCQFDTIYHEHFSYFALATVEMILARHELRIIDVAEIPTHGGSLRIFASPTSSERSKRPNESVENARRREEQFGLGRVETYTSFSRKVEDLRYSLLTMLIELNRLGKSVVGYGAPAKGNTLLNYCGIRKKLVSYTVDRSPLKQGTLLPGSRIPVLPVAEIERTRPDYLLILPWNIASEIMEQTGYIRDWGGKFIVPLPEVRVFS